MTVLPGGPVTFLFSDIEGSTRLVKALRERYAEVLAEHRRLVRAAVAAHGGHEVDTQGDAFFVAFGGAKQAVLCAVAIQRALAAHEWPPAAPVRVRIGLHTGPAVPAGGGYTGLAVHRAARICAAAAGGQVLISQATQALVEDEEEDLGFTLIDAGEYRLKGLDRPVRLFQLAAPGVDPGPAPSGQIAAAGSVAGGVHGFPAALTSFIGRAGALGEVAGLLQQCRLVTVTGPGGSGKTRLAAEVAGQVAGRFADGAWLAELAPVADPGPVASVVASALGVREQPGVPAAEAVARVLTGRQLLLVLDNCEHVIGAAAELCAGLLAACDDVTILATSREPLRVAGEARYRLAPLAVPDLEDLADAAKAEAVALFADRAGRADARFALDERTGPAVARLVTRLDGMPLAIELAAARVEALGVVQLADRLDDRFALLTAGDRPAPSRHRSLAATVEWSYRLLGEDEQRVFRAVSVFPGPFTLEAAETVAGPGVVPEVMRLVECSLLVPPQPGPDGRSRYGMLETLRAYGTRLLVEAGEQDRAQAALAGYALRVAEQAAAGLQASAGEAAAARWLDAEDAATGHVLAWAVGHDRDTALRLAGALAWWWWLRGQLPGRYLLLREVAGRAEPGSDGWCAAQFWLALAALFSADPGGSLGHCTAVIDAIGTGGPARALADCLAVRSILLSNRGQIPEAEEDGRRSLAVARELGYPFGEAHALGALSIAAMAAGNLDDAGRLARQAGQISAGVAGTLARWCRYVLTAVLIEAGDLAAAEHVCAVTLARSQDAGDLWGLPALLVQLGTVTLRTGRMPEAAAYLREAVETARRNGDWFELLNALLSCGELCAATRRPAEAVTLLAAWAAISPSDAVIELTDPRLHEAQQKARQTLGPAQVSAAEDRGAAFSADIAAEYALMLTVPGLQQSAGTSQHGQLSKRERELVTLVAQGRTDAQIAGQLYISIRTVRSHLDRIRDKTGCRRRADLTRLALSAELV
jgi:predicted ATPase/class 3 adenylate cyclase/DNA-binding CsgD family transcriptional regulator